MLATQRPDSALFDVVLILHVVASVVVLITLVVGALEARRLRFVAAGAAASPGGDADPELPASVRSYYAPGFQLAGRVLYLVPFLGLALIGLSHGSDHLTDSWVEIGSTLWIAALLAAEGLLWPTERRIQRHLAAGAGSGRALGATARTAERASWVLVAVLVAAMVVMTVQP
jgi:hypothetical protein